MSQNNFHDWFYWAPSIPSILYTPPRTPDNMATKTKQKKSPITPSKMDDESAKGVNKRGRPRVESQDQSAIERRRTQIRLAQRAYRERKETTISVLEAQVNRLKDVVQEMSKTFADFNDKTTVSGVAGMHQSLADDLRATTEKIGELHRSAGIEDDDASGTFSALSTNSRQSSISQTKPITPPTHAIHTPHYTEPMMIDSRYGMQDANLGMLGYQVEYASSPTTNVMQDLPMDAAQTWSESWSLVQNAASYPQMSEQLSPMSPGWKLDIPRGIEGASTYSWQESTFARRLLRHSHERCLALLTNPTGKIDPNGNRARYSLSFMSKEALIAKMRRTMSKTNSEPLEDWTMPMLHVGGAGLHFDRDPSEMEPPAGFTAERNIGPFQLPTAAIAVPPIYFPDKVAKWLGLDGRWFDNRDVEVYLRIKGLTLDGRSSTTVVEIEDVPELDSPSSSGSSNDSLDTSCARIPGIGRVVSPHDQLLMNEFDTLIETGVQSNRQKVVISVDKLVERLNKKCFCLGRAPGYKQSDVDETLEGLITEAYRFGPEGMILNGVGMH